MLITKLYKRGFIMKSFFSFYDKLKNINEQDMGVPSLGVQQQGMQPQGPAPTLPMGMPPVIAPGNQADQLGMQQTELPAQDAPADNLSQPEGKDAQDPQSMMIKALQDILAALEPSEEGDESKKGMDLDEDRKATISQLAKMGLRILGVSDDEDEEEEESESPADMPVGATAPEKPIGELGDMAGMSNAGTSDMPNQAGVLQPQAE